MIQCPWATDLRGRSYLSTVPGEKILSIILEEIATKERQNVTNSK